MRYVGSSSAHNLNHYEQMLNIEIKALNNDGCHSRLKKIDDDSYRRYDVIKSTALFFLYFFSFSE